MPQDLSNTEYVPWKWMNRFSRRTNIILGTGTALLLAGAWQAWSDRNRTRPHTLSPEWKAAEQERRLHKEREAAGPVEMDPIDRVFRAK